MEVKEEQLNATQVANLMDALFTLVNTKTRNVVLHCPGLGKELTDPHCLSVPSESPAVREGFKGTVHLQYDASQNLWCISEIFQAEGYPMTPGRIPCTTRDVFQALAMLGHWTGISGRLDPRDL